MSNREYFDVCDDGDHIYEQEKDRGLEQQLEEQERDPGYELISIDYSEKSWQQFSADLLNPDSQLMKDLSAFIEGGKSC